MCIYIVVLHVGMLYVYEYIHCQKFRKYRQKIINSTIQGITIGSILAYILQFFFFHVRICFIFYKSEIFCYILFYNLLS